MLPGRGVRLPVSSTALLNCINGVVGMGRMDVERYFDARLLHLWDVGFLQLMHFPGGS